MVFISGEERKMKNFALIMVMIAGFSVHSAEKMPDFESEEGENLSVGLVVDEASSRSRNRGILAVFTEILQLYLNMLENRGKTRKPCKNNEFSFMS